MEVELATTWQMILFVRSAERRTEKASLLARSFPDPEKKLVSHVVLEELNGSRENAQHFVPVALCVAGGGQFAPQQSVATAYAHPTFAWA
jgi:hypothetical protein